MDKKILRQELQNRIFLLEDKKRLKALLSDMYYDDNVTANQLLLAYEIGIVEKILNTNKIDDFYKNRLVNEFKQKFGFEDKMAECIIDIWLYCVDTNTKEKWNKYVFEKKKLSELETIEDEPIDLADMESLIQEKEPDGIFIPCGVGNEDKGFYIQGIVKNKTCKHKYESFFAVIFNYLQRNTNIDEKIDKPLYINQYIEKLTFEINYRNIYRLMMIILLLVKNNYADNDIVSFNFEGKGQNSEDIKIAFLCINDYLVKLCKLTNEKDVVKLKYSPNSRFNISADRKSEIRIIDSSFRQNKRIIWNAKKIVYKINDNNRSVLENILSEVSPFKNFNHGQFETLKEMLSENGHKVCIMPTGSGKSLIYYFCSLLQPGYTFIISPTELLIKDQIENLKKYHSINDVEHIHYSKGIVFKNMLFNNKIFYLTPETFQNRDLLKEFIALNSEKKIANLVLDEVHCISNWSHDFRPEYLMLSTYLNRYLDRTYYKCFTATANYTVIKDIKNQLKISNDENILSPVELGKKNIKFEFVDCDSFTDMTDVTVRFLKKFLIKGQKTLVFTKNEETSIELLNSLGEIKYEASVYKKTDRTAYKSFTQGSCKILISDDELGVGINLADVHNVIHFGLPISKGEYVQEIGRAGRNGEAASSIVIYLKCNSRNIDEALLHRNTEINSIIDLLNQQEYQNDYFDTYRKIIGSITTQKEFSSLLQQTYDMVKQITDFEEIEFELYNIEKIKKCLFILFAIGYINNWSFCGIDYENNLITMLIAVKKDDQNLEIIKGKTREYLYLIGGNKKSISLIGEASTIEELLNIYIDWYYNHFIYHHKEQFLDMLSFLESYKNDENGKDNIKEIKYRLASYFSLSMLEISQDQEKYANLSNIEIAKTIVDGVEYKTVSNIQKINQDNNNIKLDYFLFLYSLAIDEEYDKMRLERILEAIDDDDYYDFIESLSLIYEKISIYNRLLLFNDIYTYNQSKKIDFTIFFDMIFRQNKKDIIYFGTLAKEINSVYGGEANVR